MTAAAKPTKSPKPVTLRVRVAEGLAREVVAHAARLGVDTSEAVRHLLRGGLDAIPADEPAQVAAQRAACLAQYGDDPEMRAAIEAGDPGYVAGAFAVLVSRRLRDVAREDRADPDPPGLDFEEPPATTPVVGTC